MSFFFTYTRLSIIVVNALIFILFSSAFYIGSFIVLIKDLFDSSEQKDTIDWVGGILMLFILIYVVITLISTIFYVVLHKRFVKKNWRIAFSKFDLFSLLQFIIVATTLIVVSLVGFISLGWFDQVILMLDDPSSPPTTTAFVLTYGIPSIDLTAMLPLLILCIMCFLENTWTTFHININMNTQFEKIKKSFQLKMLVRALLITCLSFILILWGDPIITIIMIHDIPINISSSDWYFYILQFMPSYLILIFTLFIFIFVVVWYARHIIRERTHKSRQLPSYDFILQLMALSVISVFILVMCVSPFWINYNKSDMMYMTLNIVDLIFAFPLLLFYMGTYCKNMPRICNE
jgi:hypothetical protein